MTSTSKPVSGVHFGSISHVPPVVLPLALARDAPPALGPRIVDEVRVSPEELLRRGVGPSLRLRRVPLVLHGRARRPPGLEPRRLARRRRPLLIAPRELPAVDRADVLRPVGVRVGQVIDPFVVVAEHRHDVRPIRPPTKPEEDRPPFVDRALDELHRLLGGLEVRPREAHVRVLALDRARDRRVVVQRAEVELVLELRVVDPKDARGSKQVLEPRRDATVGLALDRRVLLPSDEERLHAREFLRVDGPRLGAVHGLHLDVDAVARPRACEPRVDVRLDREAVGHRLGRRSGGTVIRPAHGQRRRADVLDLNADPLAGRVAAARRADGEGADDPSDDEAERRDESGAHRGSSAGERRDPAFNTILGRP